MKPTSAEMNGYKSRLRSILDKGGTLLNGNPAHASEVVAGLFNHAQDDVRIYSGKLNAKIFCKDDVVEAANDFLLYDNKKATIILEEHPIGKHITEHKFIKTLMNNENVVFRKLNDKEYTNNHFMIADSSAFRFEVDHEECKAVVVASPSKSASEETFQNLNKIFEILVENSEEINFESLR